MSVILRNWFWIVSWLEEYGINFQIDFLWNKHLKRSVWNRFHSRNHFQPIVANRFQLIQKFTENESEFLWWIFFRVTISDMSPAKPVISSSNGFNRFHISRIESNFSHIYFTFDLRWAHLHYNEKTIYISLFKRQIPVWAHKPV